MTPLFRHVLCPSALGPRWEEVFRHAMTIAEQCDGRVTVVHGVEPLSPTTKGIVSEMWNQTEVERVRREGIARIKAELEARVERFCEQWPGGAEQARARVAGVIVEEAFAWRLVLDQARELGCDLIVMGTHDHSVVGELLGSVAHKVVHRHTIPVLLVPLRQDQD